MYKSKVLGFLLSLILVATALAAPLPVMADILGVSPSEYFDYNYSLTLNKSSVKPEESFNGTITAQVTTKKLFPGLQSITATGQLVATLSGGGSVLVMVDNYTTSVDIPNLGQTATSTFHFTYEFPISATSGVYTINGELIGAFVNVSGVEIEITDHLPASVALNSITLLPPDTPAGPEIRVDGNATEITSGDATPSLADHTDFGTTAVTGSTIERTFTIKNTGNASLTLSGTPKVSLGGTNAADFTVTFQPSSPVIASGQTTFTVSFDPSASGLRTATVSIANDDSNENPYTFAIQGTGGVVPEIRIEGNSVEIVSGDATPRLADHTDFGSTAVDGGTLTRTYTIRNIGYAQLLLSGTPKVALSGANAADFTVTLQPSSPVAISSQTIFTIKFDPSSSGLRTATVSIANDDSNENPYTFAIQGNGLNPGLLRVQTSPAVSTRIFLDGIHRNDWALNWVKLPAGSYMLSVSDVFGYATPTSVSVKYYPGGDAVIQSLSSPIVICADTTTEVIVNFIKLGGLRVETSPSTPATIYSNGNPMDDWAFWANIEPGNYTISFQTVAGLLTPPPIDVTVVEGATTHVIGNYTDGSSTLHP